MVNNYSTQRLGLKREVTVHVTGTHAQTFDAYITGYYTMNYVPLGTFTATNGVLTFSIPNKSEITFFAKQL